MRALLHFSPLVTSALSLRPPVPRAPTSVDADIFRVHPADLLKPAPPSTFPGHLQPASARLPGFVLSTDWD